MKIRYEGPLDEVEFIETRPAGRYEVRTARRGDTLDVAEDTARSLLEQGSYIDPATGAAAWGDERPWVEDVPAAAPVKPKGATKDGEV